MEYIYGGKKEQRGREKREKSPKIPCCRLKLRINTLEIAQLQLYKN